jgi:hypothetical protein
VPEAGELKLRQPASALPFAEVRMHSEDNNTLFAAWSEAERQAREAERQLYELILTQGGRPAVPADVERVRSLRELASERMNEMLAGIRAEALAVSAVRAEPGTGVRLS